MRVSLVQIDGKYPNLALMKLSSYHKTQGHTVGLNLVDPDLIYVSCVFSQNLSQAQGIGTFYPEAKTIVGGPGLEKPNHLPPEAEHVMPNYDLYGIDYSLGFTSRGCIRRCPFCMVPKLEGSFKEYADIREFYHSDHSKLVLYDNNFLASKIYSEKLNYIEENGLRVNFNQGLDARLVTEEAASNLANVDAYNFHFNHRYYHFAWDLYPDGYRIIQGLQNMLNAGVSRRNIMIYILVGFNTTHEQDLHRVKTIIDMKMDPFVMKYNHRKDDQFLNHLARWANKPRLRKSCEFIDYDRLSPSLQVEVRELVH